MESMDKAKFDYFLAKYRATDATELMELGLRIATLAEEAEAALRQAATERGLTLQYQNNEDASQPPASPRQVARASGEQAYSAAGAEIVHIRKVWFLWSLPLTFAAGIVYGWMAESVRGTLMGPPVALIGLFSLVWPLYCIYKLSRAVDPRRSVAWAMVVACFIPVIGWIAPISLVLKAGRIWKSAMATRKTNEVGGSAQSAA